MQLNSDDLVISQVLKDFDNNGIAKELDSLDLLAISSRRKKFIELFLGVDNDRPIDEFSKTIEQIRKSMSCLRPLGNKQCCVFCKKNKESVQLYSTHVVQNEAGEVVCPILQKYRCPKCGATGKKAHTVKYCPHYDGLSPVDFILNTPRNGAGRMRSR